MASKRLPLKGKIIFKSPLKFTESISRRKAHGFDCTKLYDEMMNALIGQEVIIGRENFTNTLKKILKQFLKRHCVCQYYQTMRNCLKTKKHCERQIENRDSQPPEKTFIVTLEQYQEFMHKISSSVVPKALYGCNKNFKVFKKMLNAHFSNGRGVAVNLGFWVQKWDISSVEWLREVKDENTRKAMLAKMVTWLIQSFFIPLFHTIFKEQTDLYSDKRIVIRREKWTALGREYIKEGLQKKRFVEITPHDPHDTSQWATMSLYPKPNGVRPIFRKKISKDLEQKMKQLSAFLKRMFLTRYDRDSVTTFLSAWRSETSKDLEKKTYVVTSDISDAYGSINQDKLLEIVRDLIVETPLGNSVLSKREIETMITDIVTKQYFTIGKKFYHLTIGLGQGMKLAPVLASFYYKHMAVQEFAIFKRYGQVVLFVDDFIYITKCERSASRFLKAIKSNVPEYGCYFAEKKTTQNVKMRLTRSEWTSYLGYKINGSTNEIIPDYTDPKFAYHRGMRMIDGTNSFSILKQKTHNMGYLRLNATILHSVLMVSLERALKLTELAAKLVAKRIFMIVSRIFTDINVHAKGIKKHIRYLSYKLIKLCRKHLTASDRLKWPTLEKNIAATVYRSFNKILSKNQTFKRLFCQDGKRTKTKKVRQH